MPIDINLNCHTSHVRKVTIVNKSIILFHCRSQTDCTTIKTFRRLYFMNFAPDCICHNSYTIYLFVIRYLLVHNETGKR